MKATRCAISPPSEGLRPYLRPLLSAGLVERADDEDGWVKVTGLGREFYASQGLAELPEGRGDVWFGPAVDSAVAVLSALVVDQL